MCGRYALALRPSDIRRLLEDDDMPADDGPDDDDVRQTYNFAPGYYGLVYRAAGPDPGPGSQPQQGEGPEGSGEAQDDNNEHGTTAEEEADSPQSPRKAPSASQQGQHFKFQAMKWGLVPFWTKRNPDYGSLMRTINCRDDSLSQKGGVWHTMKQKKRCIVVCQGFYEWLKKNDGKEKIPHFIKRKDGKLMCMAGLWDHVKFDDQENRLYTFTIITTENNKQMEFLHDRMPVILENGSKEMFTWLDQKRSRWSEELQNLLQPFEDELEIYPVTKEVGKVGNNSPTFIVPVNSAENKQNIANFFANQKIGASSPEKKKAEIEAKPTAGSKRAHEKLEAENDKEVPNKSQSGSPVKSNAKTPPNKRSRNALSNGTQAKSGSPVKSNDGSRKITSFFTGNSL